MNSIRRKGLRLRLDPGEYENLRQQYYVVTAGGVNCVVPWQMWKSITNDFAAILPRMPSEISSPYVRRVYAETHRLPSD